MYQCRQLTREEIVAIYEQYLVYDFPKNERKPLSVILRSLKRNEYEAYGIFDGDDLCGYAYLVVQKRKNRCCYLLDYLAIDRQRRGQGIGSIFLLELRKRLYEADMLLCEVEDPALAVDEADRAERIRRIHFYEKNGFTDTGVAVQVFHVGFRLLSPPCRKRTRHTAKEVRSVYRSLYRMFVPFFAYHLYCRIHFSE